MHSSLKKKRSRLATILVFAAIVFTNCSRPRRSAQDPGSQTLGKPSPAAVHWINELGFEGLRAIAKNQHDNQNILWAPTGFASSAFFLEASARAKTKAEISAYLRSGRTGKPPTKEDLAAFFASFSSSSHSGHWGIERMHWIHDQDLLRPGFARKIQQGLNSPTQVSDWIRDPQGSMETINRWANERSHGTIEEIIGKPLDSSTISLFVELFFVDLEWRDSFYSSKTKKLSFRRADGKMRQLSYFSDGTSSHYVRELLGGYRLATLATKDPNIDVVFIDPGERRNPLAFLSSIRWSQIQKSLAKADGTAVDWKIPNTKLQMSQAHDLNTLFRATGCRSCSDPRGDFGAMASVPKTKPEVKQVSALELNHWGIKATAVTTTRMIAVSGLVTKKEMVLDHPFALFVRHRPSSTVLFWAYIGDPASAEAVAYQGAR